MVQRLASLGQCLKSDFSGLTALWLASHGQSLMERRKVCSLVAQRFSGLAVMVSD